MGEQFNQREEPPAPDQTLPGDFPETEQSDTYPNYFTPAWHAGDTTLTTCRLCWCIVPDDEDAKSQHYDIHWQRRRLEKRLEGKAEK
jgi:hypothetical protein